ncbi:MAG: hypothetical protein ABIQ32_02180 [Sphingomicrobium sp.]
MRRTLAFLAAILLTTVTVSSACLAIPLDGIRFTLEPGRGADQVQLSLHSDRDAHRNNLSSSFRAAELSGFTMASLRGNGPIAFALIREAGRVDCAGTARGTRAEGSCRFAPNASFSALLASRGMARPTEEEAFGLTMVNAKRELLDTLAAAKYPMPSVNDYMGMTAVGVTSGYIADMARAGYRPVDSKHFIEFKAVGVTPQYVGALARAGYANLPAENVLALAALNIDPEFIRGFERIGYRNLPVETLVQLKALDVTPEYVQAVQRSSLSAQSIDKLVQLKATGFEPSARRR